MKKIISISALALGALVLSGCGQQTSQAPAAPVVQAPAVTQPAVSAAQPAATAPDADWHTYTNTKYGFTMTLADAWKGYTVSEESLAGELNSYRFVVPTTDPKWKNIKFEPLVISVFTPAQWAKLSNGSDGVPNMNKLITQNDKYVFAYGVAQDAPSDDKTDIKAAIASFKIDTVSDETANLQTYTDTQHGFSFKYSIGYVVAKEDADSINIKTVEQSKSEIPAPAYAYVSYIKDDGVALKGTAINFAGGTAMESGSSSDSGDYGTSYDIAVKKNGLVFKLQFMNKTKSTLTEADKQIISTFNFTK